MIEVGDPVFYESLGVAFDNTVADNDSMVAAVDAIIGEMREDGTLLTAVPEVVRRQGPGARPSRDVRAPDRERGRRTAPRSRLS